MQTEHPEFEHGEFWFQHLDIEGNEAAVNGVWNHILSTIFPAPRYIVCPEYWLKPGAGGSRVDLIVYDTNNGYVKLVYEGKKGRQNAKGKIDSTMTAGFISNLKQISKYLSSVGMKTGQTMYGVLALGPEYIILTFDGKNVARISSDGTYDNKLANFWDLSNTSNTYGAYAGKILQAISDRTN